MRLVDFIGYIASSLVLLTFYMKEMVPLRTAAICSNVAFLLYAALLHLTPILLLHGVLIPINVCRLLSALRAGRGQAAVSVPRRLVPRLSVFTRVAGRTRRP